MNELALNIFNDCKKISFNKNEYSKITQKYKISLKKLNQIITNYIINNYPDLNLMSFKNYYFSFQKFATGLNSSKDNKRALYYFNNLATPKEKQEFKSKVNSILHQINTINNLKDLINYLNSISLSLTEIINYIKNSSLNTPKFYKTFYTLFEPWFFFAKENNWDSKAIKKEAEKWHVLPKDYRASALNYGKYILNLDFNVNQIIFKNRYTPIIDALIKTSNEKEIITLIKENNLKWCTIKDYLHSKMCYLTKNEKIKLEQDLLIKYKLYLASNKQIPQEKNIDHIFKDFLASGLTLEEYAKQKQMKRSYLSSLIKNIKDKDLQTKVKETIKTQNLNKCHLKNTTFNNQKTLLLSYLKNGIIENGKLRKFDIIWIYVKFLDTFFWTIFN